MAFCGGHYVLCIKINPPTCKSAFLWARKKKKMKKQHCKAKNRQSFKHFFCDGAFFYNPYFLLTACTLIHELYPNLLKELDDHVETMGSHRNLIVKR
jgi:hypothetical protein